MLDQTFQVKERQNAEDEKEGKLRPNFRSDPDTFQFSEFKRIFDKKKEAYERSKSRGNSVEMYQQPNALPPQGKGPANQQVKVNVPDIVNLENHAYRPQEPQ